MIMLQQSSFFDYFYKVAKGWVKGKQARESSEDAQAKYAQFEKVLAG